MSLLKIKSTSDDLENTKYITCYSTTKNNNY